MKRFITQSWLNFKGQKSVFNLAEFLCFDTGYPLITLIFYCVLAGYSFHTTDLTRWVVGNSFLLCTNTCIFSLGSSFTGERYHGRIRSIIVAPRNKLVIVLEKGLFSGIIAIITVFLGFLVGSGIFRVDFSRIHLFSFFLIIVIGMFSATGFGLLLSTFGLITDQMHLVLNLSSYALMIFCGVNFPVSQLSYGARLLSNCLPLTRSIKAANLLFEVTKGAEVIRLLLEELLIGGIYFIAAFFLIRMVEKVAIKKATFEVF
ncbi:ABC transporter permease [Lachnoclostridium phytofermentans]|uniref:ABC-2 type transporter n=1 Tax=Lachnoclostridium phytofermentans (strain ATCC 700394 / DSM 18823 / ISDg) TaxID=357809 RepID=A9KM44_LACP7|nr:ABC transporter permease [Lachnoclostridium phytofermentans]ABX41387.1 ABC-2 type transporter [Lachnoclostridium phytofermentans ISDg]